MTLLRLKLSEALKSKSLSGGWAWICIPKISSLQWHPFSITNSSEDNFLEFHIAKAGMFRSFAIQTCLRLGAFAFFVSGDWTTALHSTVKDPLTAKSKIGNVFIEGPVGFMGSSLKKYEYLILIGAGVGQ